MRPQNPDDEDDDAPVTPARADPDEPRDESVAESLGRAVSEVVTGPADDDKVDRGMPRDDVPR